MIRTIIATILLSTTFQQARAQQQPIHKGNTFFDLAVSGSSGQFSAAESWTRMYGFGKEERLQVGYGLRFTSFVGANKFYTTAPAKYTSTRQDITTIFSETIEENIDTITTPTAITYSLNATLNVQYCITSRWDIGFNIDLVGVSFGPERKLNIISSSFDSNQHPYSTESLPQLICC